MNAGDLYRQMAAQLQTKAAYSPSATLAAEWQTLAAAYLRLAEQADNNQHLDLSFEFGPRMRIDGEGGSV